MKDELYELLEKEQVTLPWFLKLCAVECITKEEMDDLDYMEERIDTWRSLEL